MISEIHHEPPSPIPHSHPITKFALHRAHRNTHHPRFRICLRMHNLILVAFAKRQDVLELKAEVPCFPGLCKGEDGDTTDRAADDEEAEFGDLSGETQTVA
jgi:hypothetical protein